MSTPQYPPPPDDRGGQPPSGWQPPPGDGSDYGYGSGGQPPGGQPRSNGLAIAALVCGIIALLLCWIPVVNFLSIVLGIVALITGGLGLRNAAQRGGKGLAIGGLVTGGLALLASIVVLVVVGTAVSDFMNDPEVQQQFEDDLREFQSEMEGLESEGFPTEAP